MQPLKNVETRCQKMQNQAQEENKALMADEDGEKPQRQSHGNQHSWRDFCANNPAEILESWNWGGWTPPVTPSTPRVSPQLPKIPSSKGGTEGTSRTTAEEAEWETWAPLPNGTYQLLSQPIFLWGVIVSQSLTSHTALNYSQPGRLTR